MNEVARSMIEVEALLLDQLLPNTKRPLAIKIDTRGAEPYIVKAGRHTLRDADLLILEFWPTGMARMGGGPEEVIKCLADDFATISFLTSEDSVPTPPAPALPLTETLSSCARVPATTTSPLISLPASRQTTNRLRHDGVAIELRSCPCLTD